jgi:hypothetical protein
MSYSEAVKQGRELLDSVVHPEMGVLTATLTTDGKINVAAHASEHFSVGLISVLAEQILKGNMCCEAHFMAAAMGIHQVLTDLVSKKRGELHEAPDSETKH